MRDIRALVGFYRSFSETPYPYDAELSFSLAPRGQSAGTLVITCADLRVDPVSLFDAHPGELFVIRNIAGLVPSYDVSGDFQDTSATLELAVKDLGVKKIVVLGHAGCGRIRTCLAGLHQEGGTPHVDKWMSIIDAERETVLRTMQDEPEAERRHALEQDSVKRSLDNLLTFPFIKDRVEDGKLTLAGAYLEISTGKLLWFGENRERLAAVS